MIDVDELRERKRYLVTYSVYGASLDVDALLAERRPRSVFELWRKGDATGPRRKAKTSGVHIGLIKRGNSDGVTRAIERFVGRETLFLQAAARRTGRHVYSVLSCAMWVFPRELTTIWLPSAVLSRLGALGVSWGVTGYPFHRNWVERRPTKR